MFFRFNWGIIAESEATQAGVAEEDGKIIFCVAEEKKLLIKEALG